MGKHWGKALNGIANVVEQEKWPCSAQLIREAAEEIERLRAKCNQRRDDLAQAREILDERFREIERLREHYDKHLDDRVAWQAEIERLRDALERIANPITDDEVHWINTDEIVSIAREALRDE